MGVGRTQKGENTVTKQGQTRDLSSPWSAGIYKPTLQGLVRNINKQKLSPKFSPLPPKLSLCISHASRNLSSVNTTGNYKLCSLLNTALGRGKF